MKQKAASHFKILVLLCALVLILLPVLTSFVQPQNPGISIVFSESSSKQQVVVIVLNEEIDQGSASLISRGIQEANALNAPVIINMNTPGGIVADMETMVNAIVNVSTVPTYTFVGNGSSAASAGSYVAMATDGIYMGVGSVIGPSTPYIIGGTTLEEDHLANYTLAQMQSLAELHGRNVTAVSEMAANNIAFSGSDAVRLGVATAYSGSLTQTLSLINETGASIVTISENPTEQLLTFLTENSTLDGILLVVGIVAIVLDFIHPTILLTVCGAALIILALIGEEAIEGPANYTGLPLELTLFILAAVLIALEAKTQHGFMLLAGVIVGAIATILFAYQVPYSPSPVGNLQYFEVVLLVIVGGVVAIYARYIGKVMRDKKPVTGQESMIGKMGKVSTEKLSPQGEVTVNGIVWKARLANPTLAPLNKGDSISVSRIEGLTLIVEPYRNA